MEDITPYIDEGLSWIFDGVSRLKLDINKCCEGYQAWEIILVTSATVFLCQWLHNFMFDHDKPAVLRMKEGFFYYVKRLPILSGIIKQKMDAVLEDVSAKKLFKLKPGMTYMTHLPREGKDHQQVMKVVDNYLSLDSVRWSDGLVSGTVYGGSAQLTDIISSVYHKFAWSNPLHPDVFPSARKMEAEVVRMTCNLFHGDPEKSCGVVSSGGTESILLACKTYRDWAVEKRGIKKPEMIVPISVHAAFEKGAQFLGIKLIHVPLDELTRQVDLKAMKRAINSNTCMLVGSAPQFPHGTMDPIEKIAKLGLSYNIPVHVDACLGGFLIPFMREAGYPLAPFDFSLPGVTSICADTHKYAYAPKGSSILMYRDKKWLHQQYFVSPDWQGGIYATPMFAGSRSGAVVAACWATMVHIGHDQYVANTRAIISTARYIEAGVRKMPNLFIYGRPEVSVVAFGSLDFDIFRLSTELVNRGWNLNSLQFPSSIHIAVTLPHTQVGVADKLLHDIQEGVDAIMKDPRAKVTGAGALYGMAAAIPDRSMVSGIARAFIDALYDTSDPGYEVEKLGHVK